MEGWKQMETVETIKWLRNTEKINLCKQRKKEKTLFAKANLENPEERDRENQKEK